MWNHLWIPNLLWEYHICGCIVCRPNWWSLWKDTWSYFCTSIRDLMQWTLISLLVWPTKTHNTSWKRCWLRFGSGQSYQSFPKTRRWLASLLQENIFNKALSIYWQFPRLMSPGRLRGLGLGVTNSPLMDFSTVHVWLSKMVEFPNGYVMLSTACNKNRTDKFSLKRAIRETRLKNISLVIMEARKPESLVIRHMNNKYFYYSDPGYNVWINSENKTNCWYTLTLSNYVRSIYDISAFLIIMLKKSRPTQAFSPESRRCINKKEISVFFYPKSYPLYLLFSLPLSLVFAFCFFIAWSAG